MVWVALALVIATWIGRILFCRLCLYVEVDLPDVQTAPDSGLGFVIMGFLYANTYAWMLLYWAIASDGRAFSPFESGIFTNALVFWVPRVAYQYSRWARTGHPEHVAMAGLMQLPGLACAIIALFYAVQMLPPLLRAIFY